MNNEVKITVTVAELDYIMNALSLCPFREVNGFIAKLMNQANSQNATSTSQVVDVPPAPDGSNAQVPTANDALQKMIADAVAAELAKPANPLGVENA